MLVKERLMFKVVSYEKFKEAEVERVYFRTGVLKEAVVFVLRNKRKDLLIVDKLGAIQELQLEAA